MVVDKKKKKTIVDEQLENIGNVLNPAKPPRPPFQPPAPPPKEPEEIKPPAPPPEEPFESPKIMRDKSGRLTGFQLPSGEVFTAGADETKKAVGDYIEKRQAPAGSQELSQAKYQEAQQQFLRRRQENAMDLFMKYKGQPLPQSVLDTLSAPEINMYQAIASGVVGAGVGAAGGAAVGALTTGGLGSVPLALVGGAGTALSKMMGNIRSQISGEISGRARTMEREQTNMRKAITAINAGGDPHQNVIFFYEAHNNLQKEHAETKLQQNRFLAKATGQDATPELIRYGVLFDQTVPMLEFELRQAILNPDPNRIKGYELINAQEEV